MAIFTASVGISDIYNGSDAYTVYLTNEAEVVPASNDGTVSNGTLVTGNFKVLLGTIDVTTVASYSVVSASGSYDINTVTINVDGSYSVDVSGTALGASTNIILRATHIGTSFDLTLSITRSDASLNGSPSKTVRLSADRQTFNFANSASATISTDGDITLTVDKQNVTAQTVWTVENSKGAVPTASAFTATTGSDTATLTAASFGDNLGVGADDQVLFVRVTATADGLSDTITVHKVRQGDDIITSEAGGVTTITSSSGTSSTVSDGVAGVAGVRGNRQYTELVESVNAAVGGTPLASTNDIANPWQSPAVLSTTTDEGLKVSNWVKNNSIGSDGTLVFLDTVTVYSVGNQWSTTRFYNGTDWVIANEVIDGNLLVDGTISTQKIAAGAITADRITIDDNIEFTSNASGLVFNKTSLTDGTHGAFYGRGTNALGEPIAGFAVSSPTSSILFDSSGTFRLVGVDLYTGAPGTPTTYNNPGVSYYEVLAGTTELDITVIGAGGGGPNNAANAGYPYRLNGNPGGASTVQMYSGSNGSGSLLATYTASGGGGGPHGTLPIGNTGTGAAGEPSSKAPGGYGGPPNGAPGAGSSGSGGGSPGAYAAYYTNANSDNSVQQAVSLSGGYAGDTISITIVPSGTLSIKVTIGTGGTGGAAGSQYFGYWQGGASGGNGHASITDPSPNGDAIPIAQLNEAWFKTVPVWNSVAASATHSSSASTRAYFGSGAGWYNCKGGYFEDNSGGSTAGAPTFLYFSGTPSVVGYGTANYSPNNNAYLGTTYYRPSFKWFKL
jgi:hypothetical protein